MIKTVRHIAVAGCTFLFVGCAEPEKQAADAKEEATRPDFNVMEDVNQKKQSFFKFLRPFVQHENARVSEERSFLLAIQTQLKVGQALSADDLDEARQLGDAYNLELGSDIVTDSWLDAMLVRVDRIPEELVLSQAANESGWGTSRFAVEGNNYFGQWCYTQGCGLVPSARGEGAKHEVAVFSDAAQSVHAYFMNVNRNRAYAELRDIRANERAAGQPVTGLKLAEGLHRYSERGQDYVDEIQGMIRHNKQFWQQG
ncbi:glucosaminidase domain-containing protein [Photobacterium halotolerans]|uniref:glucosaminidase domain-containing protein n=1 Tax=Photobacterium halotolerans TaxID=265726 RepID=UPI000AE15BDC|nr:glucosaminidase domain-containing protein [Photobacterium halotolerans]